MKIIPLSAESRQAATDFVARLKAMHKQTTGQEGNWELREVTPGHSLLVFHERRPTYVVWNTHLNGQGQVYNARQSGDPNGRAWRGPVTFIDVEGLYRNDFPKQEDG